MSAIKGLMHSSFFGSDIPLAYQLNILQSLQHVNNIAQFQSRVVTPAASVVCSDFRMWMKLQCSADHSLKGLLINFQQWRALQHDQTSPTVRIGHRRRRRQSPFPGSVGLYFMAFDTSDKLFVKREIDIG